MPSQEREFNSPVAGSAAALAPFKNGDGVNTLGKPLDNALVLSAKHDLVDRARNNGEGGGGFVVFVTALGEGKRGVEIIAIVVGVHIYIIMRTASVGCRPAHKGEIARKGGAVETDGKAAGAVAHAKSALVIKCAASYKEVRRADVFLRKLGVGRRLVFIFIH